MGQQVVLGIEPTLNKGFKLVIVNEEGMVADYSAAYPLRSRRDWHETLCDVAHLLAKHRVTFISVGQTARWRLALRLVKEVMCVYPDLMVNWAILQPLDIKTKAGHAQETPVSAALACLPQHVLMDVTSLEHILHEAAYLALRLQAILKTRPDIKPPLEQKQFEHLINELMRSGGDDKMSTRYPLDNKVKQTSRSPKNKPAFNTIMSDAFARMKKRRETNNDNE